MKELCKRNLPYRLELFGILTYKVLAWFFLGIIIGSFVAQMQGFMPIWFIVVHIFGSIGLGLVWVLVYLRYTDNKAHMSASSSAYDANGAAPARVDSVHHAGVRMMDKHDLMVIKVTVFPKSGPPYQTTVRQFMREEHLDQLEEQAIVTFHEDEHDPGYGTVSVKPPAAQPRSDVNTRQAAKIYPERRKTGLLLLVGCSPNGLTRSVSMVLIFIIFSFGFLLPYQVTGNLDWFRLKMTYFPQKLTFQYKGNFNPEAFRKAYDKAIEYIGDRRVESVLFYKDFTDVRAEDPEKPGYVEHTTISGNTLEEGIMSLTKADLDRLFTVDSVRYDLFKKVLNDIATDHDIEDIMYIGIRKGIRWGTRDGRIPPDYKQNHVDIHVVFNGGNKSLRYHGETGVRLQR